MKRALFKYYFLLLIPFSVSARQVPDSVALEMQKQKEFRYANDPSYWGKPKPENNAALDLLQFLATNPLMKWVAYGIVALIVVIIIYQVVLVNKFSFFTRAKNKKRQDIEEGESLSAADLDLKIKQAIASNEYRLAVRYLYLKTLYLLNENNFIKLHAKDTNHEYLLQMRNASGYNEFAQLTSIYEYVWYGEFQPDNQQFEKIHNSFKQFILSN